MINFSHFSTIQIMLYLIHLNSLMEYILKNRVLTPGPVAVPEFVMLEMAKPLIHHRTSEFEEIFNNATQDLKELFQTKEEVLILASSGTGAMEAAVSNSFSKNDKVIVVNGGKFGERWLKICQAFQLNVIELAVEWGESVDTNKIKEILAKNDDVKGVLVQASETSTGVEHPIKEIAKITKKMGNTILVVDGITGVGVFPIAFDDWGIDILIGGSQKAFMLPPGLAFISLSKKAWEFTKNANLPNFYFDLGAALKNSLKHTSPWTPAVTLIIGLGAVLKHFKSIGFNQVYERCSIMSQATREGFKAIGLESFAKKHPSPALSVICSPSNIDAGLIIKKLKDNYGIIVAGGQDQAKGKILRITHMGDVDKSDMIALISAVENILDENGIKFKKGAGTSTAANILHNMK